MWWRDDDAVARTDALDRLLAAADGTGLAPVLAVIPAAVDDAFPAWLAGWPRVRAAPHGWRHANHAPASEKKAELGAHRPLAAILDDVGRGWRQVAAAFGPQALALAVPPWNRFHPDLPDRLAGLGLAGLSAFGGGPAPVGAARVDTHVDLIAWKDGRGFIGEAAAVDRLTTVLEAARTAGGAEPIGLLSHHLVEVAQTAAFLDRLIPRMVAGGARLLDGEAVLATADAIRGAA